MNPVFKDTEDNKYYFYNETWSDTYGPYESEDEAIKHLEEYGKLLEKGMKYKSILKIKDRIIYKLAKELFNKNLCPCDCGRINQLCAFKMVPLLNISYTLGGDTVDQLLEKAKGDSQLYNIERQGIVIRDVNNKYRPIERVGESLSFKVINPDYLLKYCNKEE